MKGKLIKVNFPQRGPKRGVVKPSVDKSWLGYQPSLSEALAEMDDEKRSRRLYDLICEDEPFSTIPEYRATWTSITYNFDDDDSAA